MDTNKEFMQSNAMRATLTALAILLVAFTALKIVGELKALGDDTPATNVISVSGKGEVLATPDIATFTFSVSEESAVVGDAQKKMTDKMNAILDYVKKSGVEEKDIKTSSYNIYPRYEYQGATYYVPGKQTLAAYVVSQSIQVKVRVLANAGNLLSGIGEYGATDVSGLSFTLDEQDEIQRQARDKAIVDAREQAQALAKSLGVRLGDIVSYSESSYGYPGPIYYGKDMVMSEASGSAPRADVQLPTGENKVTANVTVTYEIK